jgi:hypothetical protein
LVKENINLALVKQCLGHKSIASTMKYVGVTDSQATAAAQAALMWLYEESIRISVLLRSAECLRSDLSYLAAAVVGSG